MAMQLEARIRTGARLVHKAALALSLLSVAMTAGAAPAAAGFTTPGTAQHASFGDYRPSVAARSIAEWVRQSGDNGGTGFVVVDKPNAHVLVFDAEGRLQGHAPVLLGLA